ncbi:MAG: phosphatase PAP2 family protein [Gemmatimonas sp.]|nr:phosphatase PAP2 family protein [Gemmatimonas sp.]
MRQREIRYLFLCLVALASQGVLEAQETPEPLFTSRDALLAGGFLLGAISLVPADVALAEVVQDSARQDDPLLRAGAGFLRFLAYPGSLGVTGSLYAAGHFLERSEMAAVGLHATEAIALAVGATLLAKGLVGRARPAVDVTRPFDVGLVRGFLDGRYRSFPSGHTTAAFALAAAMTNEMAYIDPELRVPIGVALYSVASLIGASRMYHNEHWASDIVIGAAIGSFAGWKVVRYHRTRPDNRIDETFLPQNAEKPVIRLQWSIPL